MARDLRQTNRRRVLDALLNRLDTGATQPEIEDETGLSRASVATILNELTPVLSARTVSAEPPTAPSQGGRPARLFFVRDDFGAAGIDFGRSHIRVGVQRLGNVEPTIRDIEEDALTFDVASEPERALDKAAKLLKSLLSFSDAPTELGGLCIGLAGPVSHDGRIRMGPFHRWTDLDLGEELRRRLDGATGGRLSNDYLTVAIDNDANLALRGERRWGAAGGASTAIYLKWATGIGGAAYANSQLIRGAGGVAGELGHTAVRGGSGERCDWCGHHCLESVTSSKALRPGLPPSELFAIAGDPEHPEHAELVADITRAGKLIGETLAPAVNVLNPGIVIIGGMGPESFPEICIPPIEKALRGSVFPSVFRDVLVRAGTHTNRAGVIGALAAVFDELMASHLLRIVSR